MKLNVLHISATAEPGTTTATALNEAKRLAAKADIPVRVLDNQGLFIVSPNGEVERIGTAS
jgi:hypothetical protein